MSLAGSLSRLAAALGAAAFVSPLAACTAHAEAAHEALEKRIIEVAEQVKPSVVHIEAIVKFGDRRTPVTGSGVVASADGRILTNHHVVERAEKVEVSVPGRKKKYAARVIGTDPQTDVALLRIEPDEPLPAASFAERGKLRVGQWVLAVGNPYGLDGTVSFGIVSAIGRNLDVPGTLNDFIQTDAMIDRGSSGGPLVDLDARVVGINSRGQGRGIGFTIPIDTALDVAKRLEQGELQRGYLGITLQPLDRELADYLGIPEATGAIVNSVVEGSPAARAGLAPGDVITRFAGVAVDGEKEEDLGDFQRLVAGTEPGRRVDVEILRARAAKTVAVELATQPRVEPAEFETEAGFHVQELTPNLIRENRLSIDHGAFVHFIERGSPASEAGLLVGDVVERVDQRDVADLASFRAAMDEAARKPRFLVVARRGDETKFLLLKWGPHAAPDDPPDADPGPAGPASLPAPTPR
jgi:S1-C subfamily serine protease